MASRKDGGNLERFAREHGLDAGTGGELPTTGSLLDIGDLVIDGAAHGELPGGATGVVFTATWTTRSDDTTRTHHRTAVMIRLPESLGYAPYLRIGHLFGLPRVLDLRSFEPAPGVAVSVDDGVDQRWLTELFSPAFNEWLQRSPEDFGAELDAGVLVVARDDHQTADGKLVALCEDAARIAAEIRAEALEEVEAGGGSVAKPEPPDRRTRIAAALVPRLEDGYGGRPANVESRLGAAQQLARRNPPVLRSTIIGTLAIMVGVNIIGGGIYGLLLTVGDPLKNVLLYQLLLFVLIGVLRYRHVTRDVAKRAAAEAFWQGYERDHDLREVEPLRFSAEHAEAGLPGKPIRVLEGQIGGSHGFLMLTGEGRERGDVIALVRGPKGPTAVADLNVSAPGMSTAALDEHIAMLLLDLETAPPVSAADPAGGAASAASAG